MSENETLSEEALEQLLAQEARTIPESIDLWPAIRRQIAQNELNTSSKVSAAPTLLDSSRNYGESSGPKNGRRRLALTGLGLAAGLALAFLALSFLLLGKPLPGAQVGATPVEPAVPTPTPHTVKPLSVSGSLQQTLTGIDAPVRQVAWSPDGTKILSGQENDKVVLWSVTGSNWTKTGEIKANGYELNWYPDSKSFLTGDKILWNASSLTTISSFPTNYGGWSGDHTAQYIYLKPNELELQRADGAKLSTISIPAGTLGQVAWSPDRQTIVTGGQNKEQAGPGNIRVWFWNQDGTLRKELTNFSYPINSIDWSPDSSLIAISAKGTANGQAGIWNMDGKLLNEFPTDNNYVIWQLAWSPDGSIIAAACSDNQVRLFDPTGKLLTTLSGHKEDVWTVDWSPDGKILVSGSNDKTIRLWTIKTK
ncbi:MAG TPA: WD40 repeat domain-containing protein [Chloroflexia bacterium]|nr:WD40 repeat domain-containing protein [Chloroflexia bacterium]